jgi:hypothetical protein
VGASSAVAPPRLLSPEDSSDEYERHYQFEKWAVHRNSDLSVSDYGVAIGRFVVTLSRCLACGFRELGISSRKELASALSDIGANVVSA